MSKPINLDIDIASVYDYVKRALEAKPVPYYGDAYINHIEDMVERFKQGQRLRFVQGRTWSRWIWVSENE